MIDTRDDTVNHLVCRVLEEKITTWKGLSLAFPQDGRQTFLYGSSAPHFGKTARPRAVLWVFGAPKGFPASLVARITVKAQHAGPDRPAHLPEALWNRHFEQYRYVAEGDPSVSEFFAQNDFSKTMLCTALAGGTWPPDEHGEPATVWKRSYG